MKRYNKIRSGWTLIAIAVLLGISLIVYDVWYYHYLVNVTICTTGIYDARYFVAEFFDHAGNHQYVFGTHLLWVLNAIKQVY